MKPTSTSFKRGDKVRHKSSFPYMVVTKDTFTAEDGTEMVECKWYDPAHAGKEHAGFAVVLFPVYEIERAEDEFA